VKQIDDREKGKDRSIEQNGWQVKGQGEQRTCSMAWKRMGQVPDYRKR
jgi:hypothetical protein